MVAKMGSPVQDDFQAWELPTHETHRPSESMARKHLPFTATSAYHDVFVEHTLEPREVHERPQYQGIDQREYL